MHRRCATAHENCIVASGADTTGLFFLSAPIALSIKVERTRIRPKRCAACLSPSFACPQNLQGVDYFCDNLRRSAATRAFGSKLMNRERWQRVEQLYHAALKRERSDRKAFLRQSTPGDEDLR